MPWLLFCHCDKIHWQKQFRKQAFNLAHNWTLQSFIPEKPRGQVSEAMGHMASVIWWVCVISSHSSINKDHNPTQGMVPPSVDRDISGYFNEPDQEKPNGKAYLVKSWEWQLRLSMSMYIPMNIHTCAQKSCSLEKI